MNANSSKKRSQTNWKRIDSLPDSKIDYSDVPALDDGFFRHAIRWPGNKRQITLRLDPDILAFFRRHGRVTRQPSTPSFVAIWKLSRTEAQTAPAKK